MKNWRNRKKKKKNEEKENDKKNPKKPTKDKDPPKPDGEEKIVGAGSKDAKTEAEKAAAIAKNLKQQEENKNSGIKLGKGCMGKFQFIRDEIKWVDADTAVNTTNDDKEEYLCVVLDKSLCVFHFINEIG